MEALERVKTSARGLSGAMRLGRDGSRNVHVVEFTVP